jgi:integrase
LKYIRGAFNFAFEKGYINKNPTPTMKLKVGDKIKKVLTLVHVKTLLTQAKIMNSEWYPIWATAPYTGMRNGELYALTWDKVSFENRKIVIDSSWNNKDGFKGTKSGDDRIAEIVPELLILLKERKLSEIDSKFVLPRIDHWDRGEQARNLRMFLQGLGLPMVRFHDLRATWCTLMLQNGVTPIKVMKMGGWKNISTMEIYIRKAGVDIDGIMNSFELHNHANEGKLLQFDQA